jgi:hypothetical protein
MTAFLRNGRTAALAIALIGGMGSACLAEENPAELPLSAAMTGSPSAAISLDDADAGDASGQDVSAAESVTIAPSSDTGDTAAAQPDAPRTSQ